MSAILVERQKKLLKAQARQIASFEDRLKRARLIAKAERDEKRRLQREMDAKDREIRRLEKALARAGERYAGVIARWQGEANRARYEARRVVDAVMKAQAAHERLRMLAGPPVVVDGVVVSQVQ